MDGIGTLHIELFHTVDRLSDHVQHTTFNLISRRHQDRCAERDDFQSTLQAVGVVHSHAAHRILADVLLHLDNQDAPVATIDPQSLVDLRQHLLSLLTFCIEINIDDSANNLGNVSNNL